MIIRPGTPVDRPTILALARAFHAEDGHPLSLAAEAALTHLLEPASLEGFVLIADAEDGIAGYGVICIGYSVEYGGRDAFVDDLYVVPEFRAQGIARQLFQALEAGARDRGVRFLHLEVMPDNPTGEWYARRGYHDRGSRLMTKALPPKG